MRAITYDRTGPSSVMQLVDRGVLDPGSGELRVRVAVSGVNPTDWKGRQGGAEVKQLSPAKVPNQDGAGTVDAVGADVTGLAVGDRVWLWDVAFGTNEGTAQEFVNLPAAQVVPLPDGQSFDVGASLGIPALTAHRALTAREPGPDELAPGALDGIVVLVAGGAGAVGHAAIQLARWAGADVITTISSEEKAELARRAGAAYTVNYRTESVVDRVRQISERGVDVIVEVDSVTNLEADVAVAAANATIAIYASDSEEPLPVPIRPSMVDNLRFQFILTYTVSAEQKAAAVRAVSAALADGALGVGEENGLPLTRFGLVDTAQAHDAVERGVVGKVLIDLG